MIYRRTEGNMKTQGRTYQYIFGPVPSRRLGHSLGIDVIPYKICPYDCVYCQLGRTTRKTIERKEYLPTSAILEEIDRKLDEPVKIDFITFSGSGEPTIHTDIGELIDHVKAKTSIPVAVLSNGGLFIQRSVREAVMGADVIIPSLDGGNRNMWQKINRPSPDIRFEEMLEGLIRISEEFPGEIWLEVFLVGGINAKESEVEAISKWVEEIRPEKIQINSVDRPPAERFAQRCSEEDLLRLSRFFHHPVEIIGSFRSQDEGMGAKSRPWGIMDDILAIIRRRPCRLDDLSHGLKLDRSQILKYIPILIKRGEIEEYRRGGETFYAERRGSPPFGILE